MTPGWRINLPDEYAKRFEDGKFGKDLVLWRPGITCWITVYNQKAGETPAETYNWRKASASKEALQLFEFRDSKPLRFGELLYEQPKDGAARWALYTYTFAETGHVMLTIYFDRKSDLETAKKLWFSVSATPE